MTPALVLGLGARDRGDGAAGLAVARRLRRRLAHTVVAESGGEVSALLDAFQGRELLVLADSGQSGRAPGSVRRFEVSSEAWLALPPGSSDHALAIVEAVELARSLRQLPARVVVFVIESRHTLPGAPLSPEVEQAVSLVEERVMAELGELEGAPAVPRAS